jgi:hypothetical protein
MTRLALVYLKVSTYIDNPSNFVVNDHKEFIRNEVTIFHELDPFILTRVGRDIIVMGT